MRERSDRYTTHVQPHARSAWSWRRWRIGVFVLVATGVLILFFHSGHEARDKGPAADAGSVSAAGSTESVTSPSAESRSSAFTPEPRIEEQPASAMLPRTRTPERVNQILEAQQNVNSSNAAVLSSVLDMMNGCVMWMVRDNEDLGTECTRLRRSKTAVVAMIEALAQTGDKTAMLKSMELEQEREMERLSIQTLQNRTPDNRQRIIELQRDYQKLASEMGLPMTHLPVEIGSQVD